MSDAEPACVDVALIMEWIELLEGKNYFLGYCCEQPIAQHFSREF